VRAAVIYAAFVTVLLSATLWDGSPGVMALRSNAATTREAPPPEARVDINHASTAELMKVPGMTWTWAERIVRFRPYRTKQDLLDKGVVSSEVYDRIKDYVIAHRNKE
jgi:competence protein ComEA